MSDRDKDLRLRKQKQEKLKAAPLFYERTLPQVEEDIKLIGKRLDEKLAENKKKVKENDKIIMEVVSYEELLRLLQLG